MIPLKHVRFIDGQQNDCQAFKNKIKNKGTDIEDRKETGPKVQEVEDKKLNKKKRSVVE